MKKKEDKYTTNVPDAPVKMNLRTGTMSLKNQPKPTKQNVYKDKLKEYIKSLIEKELQETSVSGDAGGYTSKFFVGKPGKKNKATQVSEKSGWTSAKGMPKNSKMLDYKEMWPGKKSAMNENTVPTLQDIINKKGSLDHLKGLRLKVIDGEFTKKNPDYKNKGCHFLFYDSRSNLVGVEFISDKKSTNLYPKELVVDTEKINAYEVLEKTIKEELLNESSYYKFRNDVKYRTKNEALHKAIREVKRKLNEVDRLIDYTTRMKQELSENEDGISYWKRSLKAVDEINETSNRISNKIKSIYQ